MEKVVAVLCVFGLGMCFSLLGAISVKLIPLCLILILLVLALGALKVRNQEFRNGSAGNATVPASGQIQKTTQNVLLALDELY